MNRPVAPKRTHPSQKFPRSFWIKSDALLPLLAMLGFSLGSQTLTRRFDRVLLHKPRRLWLRPSFDNHKCFLIRSRESCFRKSLLNKAGTKEWAHFHNITNQKIMTVYLRFHVVPANYRCRADVSNKVLRWQRTGSGIHVTTRLKMITSQDYSIFLYYTVHYLQYEKASTSLPPSNYFKKERKKIHTKHFSTNGSSPYLSGEFLTVQGGT